MENPYQYVSEAEVQVDGKLYELESPTFQLNGKRKNKIDNGRGFTKKTVGGFLKGRMRLPAGMSVGKLQDVEDGTLYWKLDTGQSYTAPHAWVDGDIEISGDGFDVIFAYNQATEIV